MTVPRVGYSCNVRPVHKHLQPPLKASRCVSLNDLRALSAPLIHLRVRKPVLAYFPPDPQCTQLKPVAACTPVINVSNNSALLMT